MQPSGAYASECHGLFTQDPNSRRMVECPKANKVKTKEIKKKQHVSSLGIVSLGIGSPVVTRSSLNLVQYVFEAIRSKDATSRTQLV